ncbi:MAG: asparagine synthase C-terminal domain-containing protein [archaeon]
MKDGALISAEEWESVINELKFSSKEDLGQKRAAMASIKEQLIRAVEERIPGKEKFGLMFSGGVDSSIIALLLKKAGKEFNCYTVGFKDDDTKEPEDVEAAERAAKLIGVKLRKMIVDTKGAEQLIAKTVKALGPALNNVVNVGVAAVELGCIEMAKQDDVHCLFGGLGSEEIFAGYQRHREAKDRQEECWHGLLAMYERDLLRDAALAKASGVRFMTPFLDEKLIGAAMRVPAKLKIDSEHSKLILREVAEELGLPKEVAWRQKRAAQYGSRIDKAIDKLARRKKFKFKKDYLKSLGGLL